VHEWTVVLCDEARVRTEILQRAVIEAGGRISCAGDRRGDDDEPVPAGSLALVAMGTNETASPTLDTIRALTGAGLVVYAYAEGAGAWSIGRRCHALVAGARRVLDSAAPEFLDELRALLSEAGVREAGRGEEEERLRHGMAEQGIVGSSPNMRAVFSWVKRVSALSDVPVSIYGETGTGKELVARAIRRLDAKRRNGPFIAVNCGAISSSLVEGELFGHRRGAFTGADRDRRGLIRAADGGVLLLDEIGELDLGVQTRLLRVLQEQRVLAVGQDHEVPIDVRVVAVTHRDLGAMVRKRQFREDLFHRLNVLSTRIPPLRERAGDVRLLVEFFLEKHAAATCQRPGVTREFLAALDQLKLPGNVRQLDGIVRSALVQHRHDGPLDLADLPADVLEELADDPDGSQPGSSAAEEVRGPTRANNQFLALPGWQDGKLSDCLERCERLILENALRRSGENHSKAARLLGITPRSVYNKVRKYRLRSL
jgi:transcriptional regulator with PAS, ATPase and Fis domain